MRKTSRREFKNIGLPCRLSGCGKLAFCKGVCRMHYARMENTGSFDLPGKEVLSVSEKLLKNRRIEKSGCWIWTGGKVSGGYGEIYLGDRIPRLVHRVSFQEFVGQIPDGLFVLHKCDVRPCFNPEHLFLGTTLDNMRDASTKDRIAFGSRQPKAVLNESMVSEIRKQWNGTPSHQKELAEKYGCSQANISMVVTRKTWRRVK